MMASHIQKEDEKMNYSPSTIARIADINQGIRVDTGALLATLILDHNPSLAVQLYTVHGRILLLNLFFEVTTDLSADAAQVAWNATFSSPVVITIQPIGTKCASVSALAAGHRIVWGGGVVATAATITTAPGISLFANVVPAIIGMIDGVGTIGSLCTDATCTTGVLTCSLFYVPWSDGAYVDAIL
jgi:hypothetical protein